MASPGKKIKLIHISGIAALVLFITGCFFVYLYSPVIHFYFPVEVGSLKNKTTSTIKEVYAITPNKRKIDFCYDKQRELFYGFYGFATDIYIVLNKTTNISISINSDNRKYILTDSLTAPPASGSIIYKKILYRGDTASLISNGIRQDRSFVSLIISVSHWFIFHLAFLVLTILISLTLLYKHRHFLMDNIRQLFKNISRALHKFGIFFTKMPVIIREVLMSAKKQMRFLKNNINRSIFQIGEKTHLFFIRTKHVARLLLVNFISISRKAFIYMKKIFDKAIHIWVNISLYRLLFCCILFFIYYFILKTNIRFTDTSLMQIDERDYQCIAVNYAKGHGIHRMGAIEPFEVYKFDTSSFRGKGDHELWYHTSMHLTRMFPGVFAFFRNPGYPYFLGLIYKIFGIHPAIAKHIQFILGLLVIVLLPLLGYYIWGRKGFLSGLMAGPFLLDSNFINACTSLMTESIQPFFLILFIFLGIYHQRHRSILSSGIFGLALGLMFLLKIAYILLPVIYTGYFIWEWYKKKPYAIRNALLVFMFFSLVAVPWTIYGSLQVKAMKKQWIYAKSVIADTHLDLKEKNKLLKQIYPPFGKQILLDKEIKSLDRVYLRDSIYPTAVKVGWLIDSALTSEQKIAIYNHIFLDQPDIFIFVSYPLNTLLSLNNEYSINLDDFKSFPHCHGSPIWHTEWQDIDTSFYNNDGLKDASSSYRVINFYLKNPKYIVPITKYKILYGFMDNKFLWLSIIIFVASVIFIYFQQHRTRQFLVLTFSFIVFSACLVINTLNTGFYTALFLLFLLFTTIYFVIRKKMKIDIHIPFVILTIILNFFFLSILVVGYSRHIGVTKFIFVIVFMYLFISLMKIIFQTIKRN